MVAGIVDCASWSHLTRQAADYYTRIIITLDDGLESEPNLLGYSAVFGIEVISIIDTLFN